ATDLAGGACVSAVGRGRAAGTADRNAHLTSLEPRTCDGRSAVTTLRRLASRSSPSADQNLFDRSPRRGLHVRPEAEAHHELRLLTSAADRVGQPRAQLVHL